MRLAIAHVAVALAGCGRIGFEATSDTTSDAAEALPDMVVMAPEGCPVLPAMQPTMRVTSITELKTLLAMTPGNITILLADGTYPVTTPLVIDKSVVLRSESGNQDSVTIDGQNTATPIVRITAPNVSMISLTVANGANDGILVQPADTSPQQVDGTLIYDVVIRDAANASIRMRPYMNSSSGPFTDNGTVACSRVTTNGSSSVCGSVTSGWGINGDAVRNWNIRDNLIDRTACTDEGFRSIWFDSGSYDLSVTNNTLLNTNYGIMIGGTPSMRPSPYAIPSTCSGTPDVINATVCNNIIASLSPPVDPTGEDFSEGIALWNACEAWVVHNTVVSPAATETYTNLEYRYAGSYVHLVNNLLRIAPLQRDGATQDTSYETSNAVYPDPSIFTTPALGDVHIMTGATVPDGVAGPTDRCTFDRDGRPRSTTRPTPGAFER